MPPGINRSIASEGLPVEAKTHPSNIIAPAFQSKAPFSSADQKQFVGLVIGDRVVPTKHVENSGHEQNKHKGSSLTQLSGIL